MLRRALLALTCTLSIFGCTCTDQKMKLQPVQAPADLGFRAHGHITTLVGYGARFTGSKGWRQGIDYITATLREIGIEPRQDSWTDSVENITFTNVIATLPGTSADKIVFACHHDTKRCSGHADPAHNFLFVGANDSGSGVGLLLELARILKGQKHRATYEFVFLDGEESLSFAWDIDRALFGSRHYVRRYKQARLDAESTPEIKALVLLDMVGAVDLQIDEDTNSDKALRRIVYAAAQATGHEDVFFKTSLAVVDDHKPFVEEGIPSIDLIDIDDNPQWHTADDTLKHIAPASLRLVGEVVLTALPAIEARFFPVE